ncbi:hypothetical protein HCC61_25460 [Streptomyces sp. HNM0575]|uniref:hypothetical protein n=1 Tax=Streptomyces sp. HNM0575 TaxID=2716338 RepID=UPI00145CEE89|nr:hypothetical protein [Streptomyces sp. HNM0575]NLU75959.1 hypothetical protein [Streptomyces sp. HNM0575]
MKRKHTPVHRPGSDRPRADRSGRTRTGTGAGNGSRSVRAKQAEEERRRVGLMIEITARAGSYRKGLVAAVRRLSPEEAEILADLEQHGLQVPQLHDVLCGGHVLVDDPQLYEEWRAARGSRPRMSSHHRDIDKTRYPDIGMRGQVVREKLHGRTAQGTWVQLEKTPAAFGKNKLPGPNDLRHLMDYIVYRVTRSNVGPWGLSRMTERRPMYLSPALAVPTSLTPPVARALTRALRSIEQNDDVTAVSGDLASRFPPPDREDLAGELGRSLSGRAGRGLFGNSEVWVTQTPSSVAAAVLRERPEPVFALGAKGEVRRPGEQPPGEQPPGERQSGQGGQSDGQWPEGEAA